MSFLSPDTFFYKNPGKEWSQTVGTDGTYRFEVRGGDYYSSPDIPAADSDAVLGKNRSELVTLQKLQEGRAFVFDFDFMVETGARNTADWLLLAQFHQTEDTTADGTLLDAAASPPLALQLRGERLEIVGRTDPNAQTTTSPDNIQMYLATDPITRGKFYNIRFEMIFDDALRGEGMLRVYLDDVLIVDYKGPLGYNDAVGTYAQFGVYRESAPEAFAAQFRNLSLTSPEPAPPITGTAGADNLEADMVGFLENEVLNGLAGNDTLNGGYGADTMYGGTGDDVYVVNDRGDVVSELVRGIDQGGHELVQSYISYVLPTEIEELILWDQGGNIGGTGNAGDNVLRGNAGRNVLKGMGGADSLLGDLGNDTLDGGEGNDTLLGGEGDDVQTGDLGADRLMGEAGNDSLVGGEGNDTLEGDGGRNTLEGGAGDDEYLIDTGTDVIIEAALGGGRDTVRVSVSYDAGAAGQVEVLNTIDQRDTAAINIFGTDLDNEIRGNNGANRLSGRGGHDLMQGFGGNDVLDGGDGVDTIFGGEGDDSIAGGEGAGELHGEDGNDTLRGEAGNDTLYGGGGDDSLDGGDGSNALYGGAGDDRVSGGAGNDSLEGGTGADTLTGGADGDQYMIGGLGSRVIELAGGGNDTVRAAVSFDVGAGNEIEFLATTDQAGTAAIDLTGDDTANEIRGNDGTNRLTGRAGADRIFGYGGTDSLFGGLGGDSLVGGAGNDRLEGSDGDDTLNGEDDNDALYGGLGDDSLNGGGGANLLWGEDGNDILRGGEGTATMSGGAGDDNIYGATGGSTATGGAGNDTIRGGAGEDALSGEGDSDSLMGSTGNDLLEGGEGADTLNGEGDDDSLYGGLGDDSLNGGGGANLLWGEDGNDILRGGEGTATVYGGLGDDNIYGATGGGEAAGGAGNDTFRGGTGNDMLDGEDDNDLLYGGAGDDDLTGGDGADTLAGDAGNDALQGGLGADSLNGGAGDNRLWGDEGNDILRGGEGLATLYGGADDDNLYAALGASHLLGGTGNDILRGGAGADTLEGGAGNDLIYGGAGIDRVVLAFASTSAGAVAGASGLILTTPDGRDAITADVEFFVFTDRTLTYAEVAKLRAGPVDEVFRGTAASETLYGGDGNDTILADAGDDTAAGNGGNDSLEGGTGNDILRGNAGADSLYGGAGNDLLYGQADAADTMDGGAGDDSYYVEHGGTAVTEAAGGGNDTLRTTVTFALAADAEIEVLRVFDQASVNDLDLTGSDSANELRGNNGDNLLDGRGGADALRGFQGDDFYVIDDAGDRVFELDGEGYDTVTTRISFALGSTVFAEVLNTADETLNDALSLTGNQLDNDIRGNAGANRLAGGVGNDLLTGLGGNDTYYGGAGEDAIFLDVLSTEVNAVAGATSMTLTSDDGADFVSNDVETIIFLDREMSWAEAAKLRFTGGPAPVTGTDAAENVNGTTASEVISALGGNDWITPGEGSDTIDGGAGRDMLSFATLPDTPGRTNVQYRLDLDLTGGLAFTSGADIYQIANVERVTTTIFADRIRGSAGADELRTLGDYDWIIATTGADTYDGGTGADMVSYLDWVNDAAGVSVDPLALGGRPPAAATATGVVVDLANPANNTNLAAGHVYVGIERITGSGRADVFWGDAGENDFRGLGDYDWFVGSTGGRERYFGGDGVDTVTYFRSAAGVTASLSNGARINGQETGAGTRGDAAQDLYVEIENLVGSAFGDSLTGNSGRNTLMGLAGDDFLYGGAGIDILSGGAGNDVIDGGAGSDYAVFAGVRAGYTLTRVNSTTARITGAEGTDSLVNVEYFRFDDQDVAIWAL